MRFVPQFLSILVFVCLEGLASADEPQLELFLQMGHTNGITSVALSGDGKHVWTASVDGPTRLWDPATGKERCRLYSLDAGKDWLVVTREGFFDGSEGAWAVGHLSRPGHPEAGR